jgi:hypothetical protein
MVSILLLGSLEEPMTEPEFGFTTAVTAEFCFTTTATVAGNKTGWYQALSARPSRVNIRIIHEIRRAES